MPDTLRNITIPPNQWVDLYALSGRTVGEQVTVENTGDVDIYLSVQAAQPEIGTDKYNVLIRKNGIRLQNTKHDLGAWAYCQGAAGKININPEPDCGFFVEEKLPENASFGAGGLTLDAWGIQKVSLPTSLFHGLWTFDIPQSMWFMYENGVQVYESTNIASIGGAANLTTDATNTELILESRECPRYQPNRGHLFSTALILPNKTADGERHFGLSTDENGIFFRLKSDGFLYAVRVSGTVEVAEELIDTSGLANFDVEKGNIYDIQYQWRGVGGYFFYIGNPQTGGSALVHTMALLGTLTELSIENPALPIHYHANRITEDVTMIVGCADVTSENGITDKEQYTSCYSEDVPVNGTDSPVISIAMPLLANGKTNTRTVTLARISVTSTKKATFKVWVTRDITKITGATFKAINSGNAESFIETDSIDMNATAVRATAIDTVGMRFVMAIPVEAAVSRQVDNPYRGRIEFPLVRGDHLLITCTGVSLETDCVVEFGEQI